MMFHDALAEALRRMPKRETAGEHFYKKNYNPWAESRGDCAIRAISAAIAMKYVDVCRSLNVRFKNGVGLVKDGVAVLETLPHSKLTGYFDRIRLVNANGGAQIRNNSAFRKKFDQMPVSEMRVNLNDFCETAAKAAPDDIFVVLCHGNDGSYSDAISNLGSEDACHAVAVFAERNHPYFVDTWDSGDMLVHAYVRVKKQVAKNSPRRINMREFNLSQEQVVRERRAHEKAMQDMLDRFEGRSGDNEYLTGWYAENFAHEGASASVSDKIQSLTAAFKTFVNAFDFAESVESSGDSVTIGIKDGTNLAGRDRDQFFNAVCGVCASNELDPESVDIQYVNEDGHEFLYVADKW